MTCQLASRSPAHLAMRWCGLGILLVFIPVMAGCQSAGRTLAPGVTYRLEKSVEGPQAIHILRVSLGQPQLHLLTTVGTAIKGKETVPAMVAALPPELGEPLAAVNGDYFEFSREPRYYGALEGLGIAEGELLSRPAASAFCLDRAGRPRLRQDKAQFQVSWPNGHKSPFGLNGPTSDFTSQVGTAPVVLFTPRFGPSTATTGGRELVLVPADGAGPWLPLRAGAQYRARIHAVHTAGNTAIPPNGMVLSITKKADATVPAVQPGETLTLSTAFAATDAGEIVTALAGGPPLLAAGQVLPKPSDRPGARAPRTAVGFNDRELFLVVVDGRQPALSVGMTHHELALFMRTLGCTEALNLDGGGSSTFWLGGQVMNSPSDGRPRAVASALVLLRRPAVTRR